MALSVYHRGEEAFLGDEPQLTVSRQRRFAEMIFYLLAERPTSAAELAVFEPILNLSIDHGPETPSAKATIGAAKAGQPIGEAIAAGVKGINDVHGGAQEALMSILYKIVSGDVNPETVVTEFVAKKSRLPGFGHRLYGKADPRAELIIEMLQANDLGAKYVAACRALAKELVSQTGKILPLNIDGAIAAALCAFSWPPRLGKAVFIIARTPGLCVQFLNSS